MAYIDAFRANGKLISTLGEGNAHLVWALGLYLEEADLEALASEALTDGPDDKKIDFIYLDHDSGRIIFAQGYYAERKKDSAPSNKAADLNTASAWLISGDLESVPLQLRPVISACREAVREGEVQAIDLLYVHNLPESVNVTKELQTASTHLRKSLGENSGIVITAREIGHGQIEHLFSTREAHIEVKTDIACPAKIQFSEEGPKWTASVLTVPGLWLHGLYADHGDALFSANYRGFLGITKRRRINTGIRSTAESKPKDFWAFNNGITLLTYNVKPHKDGLTLTGVSIINGAQTTGSIGSIDLKRNDLKDVKVLCRLIQCSDHDTIGDIVKFNNTQNEITTWDQYSSDPDQIRIQGEFEELGHKYSRKRGFRSQSDDIGIEEVVQPLVAFHGRFSEANRGKNGIFDRKPIYNLAFSGKKARHILFVYTLAKAIDEKRIELKNKSTAGLILSVEEPQLQLLRNLKFKYFLMAMVAKCVEIVLGKKVDVETVAFSPEASKKDKNSIIELVASWSSVVETVLVFLASQLQPEKLSEQISDEAFLETVAKPVCALLYTSRNNAEFQAFSSKVTES